MTLTHFTVQAPAPGYNGFASGAVVNARLVFREFFSPGSIALAVGESPPVGIVPAETAAMIVNGVLYDMSGSEGVRLKCDQAALGMSTPLQYHVSFSAVAVDGKPASIGDFTFNARTTDTPLNLLSVTPVPVSSAEIAGYIAGGFLIDNGDGTASSVPGGFGAAVTKVAGRSGDVTLAVADVAGVEATANKNQPGGYTGLDGSGKVASAQLPSYVDDVLDFPNFASFPNPGEAGKIYIDDSDATGNNEYRWNTGTSAYIVISKSPGSTDAVAEGTANLYYTDARAQAANATALAGKQFILTATAVKTSAYTAAANELVPASATTAAFTVTLPTAPADKTRVVVKKIDASANAVTVATGGSDVFNVAAGSATLALTLQFQAIQLQYAASSGLWYVISTDVPLGGLDTRYVLPTVLTTKGDLYAASAASTPARVGVGADNSVLTANSAAAAGVSWTALSVTTTAVNNGDGTGIFTGSVTNNGDGTGTLT